MKRYVMVAGEKGFTFLEVLLSIFIIGLAIIPVIELLAQNQRRTLMTGSTLVAQNLAGSVMNRLRRMPFERVVSFEKMSPEDSHSIEAMLHGTSLQAGGGKIFIDTVELSQNFKQITVRIEWEEKERDGGQKKRKVELDSLISRKALETRKL